MSLGQEDYTAFKTPVSVPASVPIPVSMIQKTPASVVPVIPSLWITPIILVNPLRLSPSVKPSV